MKKTVEKEVEFCDFCGKEMPFSHECRICGKASCYECDEANLTTFNHAVNFSGSGDGTYCNKCLGKPIPKEHLPLLQAYHGILNLCAEAKAWHLDFDSRTKTAESRVKELLD